ncbi:tubulin-tyrosine ligase/tubulin polyglutamylase [Fadolivirus algeromassiliense]|jgi:hypothetical protein|uniref:Tubulin-tyrosine ligase/tubulin polyglutamylase n=1 Tax=Fadolivirus FV1/VV64 TaxID=3070911 RepID=A0A7D3V7F9_9VIRU|nr:tubulin-tyrosine ligase/tubulin polyglutamylase [Fadolivirus algeromassiliense]QKF93836.1 tubulin-tyrosine ligase/tubulin polyglutamylase [Fadolivirus FV1/VV64]
MKLTNENILIITLLSLIGFVLVLIIQNIVSKFKIEKEHMVNINPINTEIKWGKDPNCKYKMTETYLDILKEYSIKESTGNDWVIYFPCTYNNNKQEIGKIKPSNPDQRIFIVTNTDEIASKSNLWKNLVKKYGREKARDMSPISYVLYDESDKKLFETEYNENTLYIMKKNIQRQEGLKISNDKEEILNGYKDNYVIAQELLQDPYLIRGRKTNMRFYVLLVCQNNEISAYVHKEGFMYYTKMPFIKGSKTFGNNITTGYIERWIYHVNPLTHTDFRTYLDDNKRDMTDIEKDTIKNGGKLSEIVFNRINLLITNIVNAISFAVCQDSHIKNYITFQLFGVDIAVDNRLEPKVMEVNIGPNLATHDKRDSDVKHMVVRDIFKTLKIVPDIDNNFIKIL